MAATTGAILGASAIGAGANILGGLIGQNVAAGDRRTQEEMMRNAYNQIAGLQTPDIEKMKLLLEGYTSAGTLTPQQEQAILMGATDQLQNIQLDPRLRTAQMQQLEALQKLGDTGISPVEQAELNKLRRQTEADAQARMRQQLEDQQRRGVGTSEAALMARLAGGQSAVNRQSEESDRLAALAFQRALQSKTGAAQLAGQLENVDYSRAADLASALRAREQANVAMQSGVQQRNIDRFNQAQSANLANQQRLAEMNVAQRNRQQEYNKQLLQQQFENEYRKRAGLAGAQQQQANFYGQRAADTQQMYAGIGGGLGQIGSAAFMGAFGKPTDTGNSSGDTVSTGDLNKSGPVKMIP